MDLTAKLMPHLFLGSITFLEDSEIRSLTRQELVTDRLQPKDEYETCENRQEAVHHRKFASGSWRIDGCSNQGTRFFVVPTFFSPTPLRIDVLIPDQSRHPLKYRKALDSASTFCMSDDRVAELGISKLIAQALDIWTQNQTSFQQNFSAMPFGSRIVLENIDPDPHNIRIKLISDFTIERIFSSLDFLQSTWNIPESSWPAKVSLESLVLVRQIQDTVGVVQIPGLNGNNLYVFKTATSGIENLYHELKLLLTLRPNPHVMPRPRYLVVRPDRYTKVKKVYGFVMEYYPKGNLASILATRAFEGSLKLSDQYKWAKQIASTLSFIQKSPARYYSELKTDNLLVSERDEDIVFIDFEQMGNWVTFSAPEIHYVEYLTRLVRCEATPQRERDDYRHAIDCHVSIASRVKEEEEEKEAHFDATSGHDRAWNSLSDKEQEAAVVYSLGMTLWCIFEGCSNTRNSPFKWLKHDRGLEFPTFQRTPPVVQGIILQCTKGSPFLREDLVEVYRKGSRIIPRGKPDATAIDTLQAARGMWRQRVSNAKLFLEARSRWRGGRASDEDKELLGFMLRPTLDEVLEDLQRAETAEMSMSEQ